MCSFDLSQVISNTVILSLLTILISFPVPVIFALLLNQIKNNRRRKVVQTISYAPYFVSNVVVVSIISVICAPSGFVNTIIKALNGGNALYLTSAAEYFRMLYIVSNIWQTMGFSAIVYIAALTGISQDYYEAAIMDGATKLKRILYIDIPLIMPTIIIMFILSIGNIMSVSYTHLDVYKRQVVEKLLRFGRAAVAVATMRGKSYLQIGSICMGIGGSIIDPAFIEEYLGMRVESVDEVEIIRRMTEGIYDKAEFEKALAWTKANCIEGFDKNPEEVQKSREKKDEDWEFVVKMMCIIKDLMNGNKNLPVGCEEEMVGHNAIAAGFQGQRQWTDFYPNCDFAEAMLNTSFDWNGPREPYVLATENDVLNGLGMMFMKLLTNRAQIFADVRTYWSPEAVKKATGYEIEGVAKEAGGFIHLINSGAACLDANGQAKDKDGNNVMKPWYEITQEDQKAIMEATTWNEADFGYFRGGGYSSRFVTEAQMPVTMIRLNLVKGLGPMLQIAEGWTVKLPDEVSDKLWKRTDYTWPCTWFAPRTTGKMCIRDRFC